MSPGFPPISWYDVGAALVAWLAVGELLIVMRTNAAELAASALAPSTPVPLPPPEPGVLVPGIRHPVIVVDGFIASAAALAAARLAPRAARVLIASHRSVEAGHGAVLGALDLRPLLELDLRLGEGTGAALALHLVEAAARVLAEMATFDAAGVSDAGR